MEIAGWIILIVWAIASILITTKTISIIKKYRIAEPATIIISLVLTLMAYGGWTIALISSFSLVFVSVILFLVLGCIAKKIIERHQLICGKNKITNTIHGFTIPSGLLGTYAIILIKGVVLIVGSLFKDMSDEMDRNAKADAAADKFLRDRVPRTNPINYETECDLAYREYINSTGTEDTGRNRDEFKKKYFHHIYD